MSAGRPDWTTKVPSEELQAIHEWIDDEANYKSIDIYRQLKLGRYTRPRSFRRYVEKRRESSRERVESGTTPPSSFSRDSLEELTRAAIGKALLTETLPAYRLHSVLSVIQRSKIAEVRQQAEQRAQELHDLKMKAAAEQLDEMETSNELTPEQVVEIKRKVLGL